MARGLSKDRLPRLREAMVAHVAAGVMPGVVALVDMDSPQPPKVFRDFWTGAYQAFED